MITNTVIAIYLMVEAAVRQMIRKSTAIKARTGQLFFRDGAAAETTGDCGGAAGVAGAGDGCAGAAGWLCAMRFRRGCFFAINMTSRSM